MKATVGSKNFSEFLGFFYDALFSGHCACLPSRICGGKPRKGTRKMDEKKMCSSADKPLENYLSGLSMEVSHNRMVDQENKCGYGTQGVCCRLCSNGPCRISRARPRGVCGADADTIAARNFLRSVAAGSGCYIHVVENAAKQLKETARKKEPLKGLHALDRLSKLFGITGFTDWDKAGQVADAVLADLHKPIEEKMKLVEKAGYPMRVEKWKELGILPGGAKDEIFNAVVKTSTNLNSDPVDMLMQCLRLGVSTGIYGLVLTNLINDVLLGESKIGFDPVGLRVIDPAYINIMITGHQQALFNNLQEALVSPAAQQKAEAVGAKGIRIVGCTCVGQDFQVRKDACTDAFCGHAGNNYTSEAVLSTGCIDLVLSEFNCTIPGIEPICDALQIPQICLDDVAKKKNAEYMPYSFAKKKEISEYVIDKAVASYAGRKDCDFNAANCAKALESVANPALREALAKVLLEVKKDNGAAGRTNPMAQHGYPNAITGVTEETLRDFLGGSYQPLIDLIVQGKIKGIAAVVGCSNLRAKGHDVFTVELTKQLIAKDILVLAAGCTCGGLENCGLMSPEAAELAGSNLKAVCQQLGIPPVLNFGPCLAIGRLDLVAGEVASLLGVDLPQLPLVLSAPQWLEEQALADGCFGLALGFTVHLGLPPFVTGSPVILDVLTRQLPELTGGRLIVDTDVQSSADTLEQVILEKRKNLGI